jgi:GNAT superfamily N-acetyltransferase
MADPMTWEHFYGDPEYTDVRTPHYHDSMRLDIDPKTFTHLGRLSTPRGQLSIYHEKKPVGSTKTYNHYYAVHPNGQIVGSLEDAATPNAFLSVHQDWQKMGIGSHLLRTAYRRHNFDYQSPWALSPAGDKAMRRAWRDL